MAKWRHKNIYIYFNDIFGSMGENCLPYMPESFTCNINGRNEEIDILHGVGSDEGLAGTMNFVKRPGLKTWSIECFFSHPDRPLYATVKRSHHWTPEFWVEFFESAMYQMKVLEMTVSGLDIVTYVTIENFKHTKEAGEEIDTYYTIEIKEYQFQEIKQEEINIKQEIPKYDGQNTNQQPTVPPLDGYMWLVGRAWKYFLPKGKTPLFDSDLLKDTEYGKVINFNWLKCIKRDEREIPAYNLSFIGEWKNKKAQLFADNAKFVWEGLSGKSNPADISYIYKRAIELTFDLDTSPKILNLLPKYLSTMYGFTSNIELTWEQFTTNEDTGKQFLRTLLTSEAFRTVQKNPHIYLKDRISNLQYLIKARSNYAGNFTDNLAVTTTEGGGKICNVEVIDSYSYTKSAGDLKILEYQGNTNGRIVFTLNKGDKIWCLEEDLHLSNNGNLPFTLSYFAN